MDNFIDRASYAKVNLDTSRKPAAAIEFSEDVEQSKYRLMELTPELLKLIESGTELIIRGDEEDGVVLCSENQTYDIKNCTTSNQLLITPNMIIPDGQPANEDIHDCQIVLRAHDYFEPKRILPKTDKLNFLLPHFSLASVYQDGEPEPEGRTFEDLMDIVQGSSEEVLKTMKDMGAIDHDGWKIFTDLDQLCTEIAETINYESLQLNEINLDHLCETINSAEKRWPKWAIQHALFNIGSSNEDNETFDVDPKELSIQVGHWMIMMGKKMEKNDFFVEWKNSLPVGTKPDLSDLFSFSYLSEETKMNNFKEFINYIDPITLPIDAFALFDMLFKLKPKWSEQELIKLTAKVTPPGKKAAQVIQKYCRATKTPDGRKEFTIQMIK